MIKTIVLNNRPVGKPTVSNFEFKTENTEITINKGEVLLEAVYVSVDPYLRGRMSDAKSYIPSFELNKPIQSGVIAKVITSKNDNFKEGDFVSGMLSWKTKQVSNGEGLLKVDGSKAPLSTYLGVLGMTGLTAYLGLHQIGKPTSKDINADIKKAAPNGVDIYFDNVGGPISDAVLFNINRFARMIICGAISVYNNTEIPKSVSVQPFLVKNSALMQGFIVSNYADKFPEAIKHLSSWLVDRKLTYTETIVDGFDNIPNAFIDLFEGKNKGKMIVKI